MTNVTRYFARDLDPTNELERGLPCVVRHEDAGGHCQRTATVKMYEILNFCPEHGEEAKVGALMEAYQDAGYFFDRFRNPHVPDFNAVVEEALVSWAAQLNEKGPKDDDHYWALARAYPDAPEREREMILRWERDERANGGPTPADLLLDSYYTICKLMRRAHEDGEDWLVEILEDERQETAARAAFACEINGLRPAE